MRTDSTNLADEAVREIRDYVAKHFNADLPAQGPGRVPQQVQECAGSARGDPPDLDLPHARSSCKAHLTPDQARLYEMIWKRTLACQMAPARYDTTARGHRRRRQGHAVPRHRPDAGVPRLHRRVPGRRGRQRGGRRREAAGCSRRASRSRSTASSASSTSPCRRRATPKRAW